MDKDNKKPQISMDFLQSYDMGPEFVLRMVNIYINDIPAKIDTIKTSLKEPNYDTLRIAVHTLGSHVRDIGAKQTYDRLLSIENEDISSMNKESLSDRIDIIISECEEILIALLAQKEQLLKKKK